MARLFLTEREIGFINDLTKEIIKDVIGQVIHYYPVSSIKSKVHAVYNEAIAKVFENPIKINALVGQPEWSSKTTGFGPDIESKLEVMIQARDIQDKGITLSEGDFFSYDDIFYEILTVTNLNNIYGMAEYTLAWKITAKSARINQLDPNSLPRPRLAPEDAQKRFEQQRGLPNTSDGEPTGDIRELQQRLQNDMTPIALGTGPRVVEPHVDPSSTTGDWISGESASSFVNEPLPPKKGIYEED